MSRFVRFAVLLLVAAWLPVTMHCRLEAAGLIQAHDGCASEQTAHAGTNCTDDACAAVEATLIKDAPAHLVIAAAANYDCTLSLLALLSSCRHGSEPTLSPARHAPPAELLASWQFSTRAAPPARAPGALNT
jgi:hypothetical protein